MAYVSFVAQLLNVNESAGGVDVCLQMRGFTEIELIAIIATSQDTAIGKNIYPILLLYFNTALSLSLSFSQLVLTFSFSQLS